MDRKIDDRTYLKYLLPSLNVKDLKEICREYDIKGYSKLTKEKIIEFILDSQSEEEMRELIKNKEISIIEKGIKLALDKIKGKDRENISSVNINIKLKEVEVSFKGFNWETNAFILINESNIENPERDCDCNIGGSMGFCSHFWVCFIISLKKGFFSIKNWSLTILPEDFEKNIKTIAIKEYSIGKNGDINDKEIKIIDESSADSILTRFINESITVYEGTITEIEEKQSDFQGNITTYYSIILDNAKLGHKLKKKSDFKKEDLLHIKKLTIRVSESLQKEQTLALGDKISFNGKLSKDNLLGIIVKNIRKIQKV
ncbi:MAG: Rho termination factor N-terminal domain-containing protein [Candidatus Lokiarchaeota archaeon]|nr:Rho termination factor N-terminal domain-containing protein [Candidatus Lokiarchaeota archaeon]